MIFRSYRKRKALESYSTVLGPRLRGRFGRREHYTADEVISTVGIYRLSRTYLCYALAMYCDRETFDAYHAERGDAACSYARLWREVSYFLQLEGSTCCLYCPSQLPGGS
jgi:hypothetical protein